MEFTIILWHPVHGGASQCVGGCFASAMATARACCVRGWQLVCVTQREG